MKLYLAGNFTVTDEVQNEVALEKTMKEDYNRLCTFFYPKAADVIIQNKKPKIKKEVEIKEKDLSLKTHPAIGEVSNGKEDKTKEKNTKKRVKVTIKRSKNL